MARVQLPFHYHDPDSCNVLSITRVKLSLCNGDVWGVWMHNPRIVNLGTRQM
jgi:hypothetical protein